MPSDIVAKAFRQRQLNVLVEEIAQVRTVRFQLEGFVQKSEEECKVVLPFRLEVHKLLVGGNGKERVDTEAPIE